MVMGNYIILYKKRFTAFDVAVNSSFDLFKSEIIVTASEEKITFQRASLDYRGKSHKYYQKDKHSQYYTGAIYNIDLKEGKFFIDLEESTEDCVVVYLI